MGEPDLIKNFESESELVDFAAEFSWVLRSAGCFPLVLGLRGDLGSGKTTWARAMLRGLGFAGRVPSPTYTLLEQYPVEGVNFLHLDLYRLAGDSEIENLGVRDWLADPRGWMVVEWPERAPRLEQRCDVLIDFADRGDLSRRVRLRARTGAGIEALEHSRRMQFKNDL